MAKREISSTLKNLKFMQRSASKEDNKKKKNDDEEPNGNFTSLGTVSKKCVVITDWDPKPGALLGRMSFQSFNPSIEKLSEDASSSTSSTSNGSKVEPSQETNGDLKRKQCEVVSEEQQNHPNKSPRSSDKPWPRKKKGDAYKKPKSKKVDWSVLKPPKPQTKQDSD